MLTFRLIKDKEGGYRKKRGIQGEFGLRDVIDVEKERIDWSEQEDSDDGLEEYIQTGRLKIKY